MRFVSVANDNVVNIMFVSMSSKYPTCLSSTYMMCFATVPRTIQIDSKLRDAYDDLAAYIASIHDRVVIVLLLTKLCYCMRSRHQTTSRTPTVCTASLPSQLVAFVAKLPCVSFCSRSCCRNPFGTLVPRHNTQRRRSAMSSFCTLFRTYKNICPVVWKSAPP